MIENNKINLAFLCITIFSLCLIGGFFFNPLFVLAVIALVGYVWVDKRYLRCPHCDGFENLDRLFYAKHHTYHCRHCGEIIKIETKRQI